MSLETDGTPIMTTQTTQMALDEWTANPKTLLDYLSFLTTLCHVLDTRVNFDAEANVRLEDFHELAKFE